MLSHASSQLKYFLFRYPALSFRSTSLLGEFRSSSLARRREIWSSRALLEIDAGASTSMAPPTIRAWMVFLRREDRLTIISMSSISMSPSFDLFLSLDMNHFFVWSSQKVEELIIVLNS